MTSLDGEVSNRQRVPHLLFYLVFYISCLSRIQNSLPSSRQKREFLKSSKGPGIPLVINSSENGIIIFGIVPFGEKFEPLLEQA